MKEYHPNFEVGKALNGIICDWSDKQVKGLELAVGVDVANQVLKGCQVSITRINLHLQQLLLQTASKQLMILLC